MEHWSVRSEIAMGDESPIDKINFTKQLDCFDNSVPAFDSSKKTTMFMSRKFTLFDVMSIFTDQTISGTNI